MNKVNFKPQKGGMASYFSDEDNEWFDVKISKVVKNKVSFQYPSFPEEGTFDDDISEFEPPMLPDVNDRFKYYERTLTLAFTKRIKSMIVLAQAGLGKSHILELVKNAVGAPDVTEVRGYCTPLSLYKTLYENQHGTVIFDDCDSVLEDGTSGNLLKAVLDTTGKRIVSWKSAYVEKEGLPTEFAFQGTIIFLSNKPQDKMQDALLSRSIVIDLYLSLEEMIDRLEGLLPHIDSPLGKKERANVLAIMRKYRTNIKGLSVRTLKLALDLYETTEDLDMVKYQLLCKK